MTVASEYQDYVQALADLLKELRASAGSVMELSASSSPTLSADAPAIDYKLSRAGTDPEQIMLLRVNFTSYQKIGNRHELTLNSKTRIRLACDAFCHDDGVSFNV
jgi:hypothetical protein